MPSSRSTSPKFRIPWPQLEWRPENPGEGPGRDEGSVFLLVIAPWCPDCQELGPNLGELVPRGRKVWLVGEFARPEEVRAFADQFGISWPLLFGASEKSETLLARSRFKVIRQAFGDTRKWGLPLWIEGELRNDWLEIASAQWPS